MFFVWTLGDVVGLVIFGLVALFFAGVFALLWFDKLWWKVTGKHLPYNRLKAKQ